MQNLCDRVLAYLSKGDIKRAEADRAKTAEALQNVLKKCTKKERLKMVRSATTLMIPLCSVGRTRWQFPIRIRLSLHPLKTSTSIR